MTGSLVAALAAAACGWHLKAASAAREDARNLREIAGACKADEEGIGEGFSTQAEERDGAALSNLIWAAGCAFISINCALGAWGGAASPTTW